MLGLANTVRVRTLPVGNLCTGHYVGWKIIRSVSQILSAQFCFLLFSLTQALAPRPCAPNSPQYLLSRDSKLPKWSFLWLHQRVQTTQEDLKNPKYLTTRENWKARNCSLLGANQCILPGTLATRPPLPAAPLSVASALLALEIAWSKTQEACGSFA